MCNLLFSNVKRRNANLKGYSILIFDSFDEANNREIAEGKIYFVNFSFTIVDKDLLGGLSNYSTSKTEFALTWMNIAAK